MDVRWGIIEAENGGDLVGGQGSPRFQPGWVLTLVFAGLSTCKPTTLLEIRSKSVA